MDRKCHKLTYSMSGFPRWLAYIYVLINKLMSTPEESICHFPDARVAWSVCSAESCRNWHESLLPLAIHEEYEDKATENELWLVS